MVLQVMSALHMIMQKWKQENVFRDHPDMDPNHVQLRIVMLGKLCGAVIGENGKTINDIKLATHTDIRVQVLLWQQLFQCTTAPASLPAVHMRFNPILQYPSVESRGLCPWNE